MKPYPHQEKFGKGYGDKAFLVHETGTGKTICACLWIKDGRDSDALVICPKRVVKKWNKALSDWGTKATVLSIEQFKNYPIKKWSSIVVDEADEFASPLFTRQRSKRSEFLYNLIKAHDVPIALLTATPIRSNIWNLHTLLCFLGKYFDYKKWRDSFSKLEYRPYLPRPAYFPVKDWREKMRNILEKYADIYLLRDLVDILPPAKEEVVNIKEIQKGEYDNFFDEHRVEQRDKHKEIISLSKGYRKVLVVAHYVEQVKDLAKVLEKDRQVFMVYGGTRNQEEVLEEANKCDECFLVIQAGIGVGFDADTFSCVIFSSMSYKVRDWVQMKGRVRRVHNLHPVVYYYLLSGRCDRAVYETIMKGKDFVPSEWDVTKPTKEI